MKKTFDSDYSTSPKSHSPVTTLYLTPPEVISTIVGDVNNRVSTAEVRLACKLIRQIGGGTKDDDAIVIVESALRTLKAVEETSGVDTRIVNLSKDDHREYDEFFRVVRVCGDPALHFVSSLCLAYRNLLVNAKQGHSLPPTEWSILKQAFSEYAELLWIVLWKNQEEE